MLTNDTVAPPATQTAPTAPRAGLETVTCSRCCGSGNYSWCQRYGTTCFKCGGRKAVLTKRGAAAAALLDRLRSKPQKRATLAQAVAYQATLKADGKPYKRPPAGRLDVAKVVEGAVNIPPAATVR